MKTASIYQDVQYSNDKPLIKVLLETDFTKEIRIAMQKGTLMKEHQTPYPIVVELIEGDIDFNVQDKTTRLNNGDLIALEGGISHELKANENSIIRLTLTKYDNAKRVKNIIGQ